LNCGEQVEIRRGEYTHLLKASQSFDLEIKITVFQDDESMLAIIQLTHIVKYNLFARIYPKNETCSYEFNNLNIVEIGVHYLEDCW